MSLIIKAKNGYLKVTEYKYIVNNHFILMIGKKCLLGMQLIKK